MFKPTITFVLVVTCLHATSSVPTFAQFGGTQDMMLEKQNRQNQQNTANPYSRPSTPATGNANNPSVNNNYYIQVPGYRPYGYYNQYPQFGGYGYSPYGNGHTYNNGYGGSGDYYGYPYQSGPILYPPSVTGAPYAVPFGIGSYGVPLNTYGRFAGPSVAPERVEPPSPPPMQVQPSVVVPPPAGPRTAEDEIKRRVAALKPSTDAGRLQCDELIADGDREFAAQQYRKAAAKYREGISKAPDYPTGHLRAGHAYIGTGDYELAVTYFAMGFELSRTIQRPDFSLEDLYKGNEVAKEQHQESLADAVLRQPNDGGLLFLTGLFQHYDNHPLQARDYFRRAAEIPGRHQQYAAMFVPK